LGIHSYLSYLRDRLVVARELLTESGSIFVQIGDDNLHLVRTLLDEVFGTGNFCALVTFRKTSPLGSGGLASVADYVVWYARDRERMKFHAMFIDRGRGADSTYYRVELPDGTRRDMDRDERDDMTRLPAGSRAYAIDNLRSSGFTPTCFFPITIDRVTFRRRNTAGRQTAKAWSG